MTSDEIRAANRKGTFGIEFAQSLGPVPSDCEPNAAHMRAVADGLKEQHVKRGGHPCGYAHLMCPLCFPRALESKPTLEEVLDPDLAELRRILRPA